MKSAVALAMVGILVLGGCSTLSKITNPVQETRVYELENAYGIAQRGAITYTQLPRCGAAAAVVCSKPAVVVALGEADKKARIALTNLENFSRSPDNYPTLTFGTLLAAAQTAINTFSALSKA